MTGPIAFDDKGDLKNGPITLYVVKGGKWEPLETVVARRRAGRTRRRQPERNSYGMTSVEQPASCQANGTRGCRFCV